MYYFIMTSDNGYISAYGIQSDETVISISDQYYDGLNSDELFDNADAYGMEYIGSDGNMDFYDCDGFSTLILYDEDSSTRKLEKSDLSSYTSEQLRIARNEIYARHGRLFKDDDLQKYFNSKDWYDGYISASDFDDSMLNDIERANIKLIKSLE